jgi:hypothetical protein
VVNFGILIVFKIVLERERTASKLIIFRDFIAAEVGGLPLVGEPIFDFDFELKDLDIFRRFSLDDGIVLALVLILIVF